MKTFNVGLSIGALFGLTLWTLALGQVPERNYIDKKGPLEGQINLQLMETLMPAVVLNLVNCRTKLAS